MMNGDRHVVERNSIRSSPLASRATNGTSFVLRVIALACGIIVATVSRAAAPLEAPPAKTPEKKAPAKPAPKPAAKHITESIRGKVVWISEALARKHGVRLDADAAETMAAIETADGELIPLMKEDRGRGFWKDERLRGIDVELIVRRYKGVPLVQVIRVYRLKDGKKYDVDYWCDICAIQMFELKDCECCQGPIRLRERLVEEKK
jgi:hypothetical protein